MSGGPPDKLLQRWGVIAGAGVVAAALAVSSITRPDDPAPAPAEPVDATSSPAPATPTTPGQAPDAAAGGKTIADPAASGDPGATAQPTNAGGPPPAGAAFPSLLVRFEPSHPMARAQTLAAAGRFDEAAESARQTIRTRRDLRGLCYDRFTNGGAEVVLRACTAVPRAQRTSFQETWARRLSGADGVEYAEPNYTLYPETKN
ncbi:MAG: hypothetical protein GC206_14245 [Alphaproteobacteria bacterium]|nr:hypothetical protein [Alphaproteobacteria bacterium]